MSSRELDQRWEEELPDEGALRWSIASVATLLLGLLGLFPLAVVLLFGDLHHQGGLDIWFELEDGLMPVLWVGAAAGLLPLFAGTGALLQLWQRPDLKGFWPAAVGLVLGLLTGGGQALLLLIHDTMWNRYPPVMGRPIRTGTAAAPPDPSAALALSGSDDLSGWAADAQMEYESAPAFGHLALSMAALGAPLELQERCYRAALEELEHARLCRAEAALDGHPAPAERPLSALVGQPPETDPARLLLASVMDGVVGEGAAARAASLEADRATRPSARAALQRIAREEQAHADLAQALIDWLQARHPSAWRTARPTVLRRLRQAAAGPRDTLRRRCRAERAAHVLSTLQGPLGLVSAAGQE